MLRIAGSGGVPIASWLARKAGTEAPPFGGAEFRKVSRQPAAKGSPREASARPHFPERKFEATNINLHFSGTTIPDEPKKERKSSIPIDVQKAVRYM